MKKIKVIDLFNKISNGEMPKKIIYNSYMYEYEEYDYFNKYIGYLFDKYNVITILNDTLTIIEDTPKEDNKIEKIKDYSIMTTMGLDGKLQKRKISKTWKLEEIVNKINEIIDKVNGE